MNDARFEELLDRLLENELSDADGDELANALRAEPGRGRELRRHLALWELWSQQHAPERSVEAFCASWRERLRAEEEPDGFLAAVRSRIALDAGDGGTQISLREWWRALWRAPRAVWLPAATMTVLAVFFGVWLAHRAEAMVTIQGEAVCPACVLHIGHEHVAAIRTQEGGSARVYFLAPTPELASMQPYFCSGPNPITIEGRLVVEADRTTVSVNRIVAPPVP
ncbi:MAG TPA: hypothetical protein VK178_10250 [Opitutaceae bacterium]|nr:hypothetical protein [Opitutaceae bacterium]